MSAGPTAIAYWLIPAEPEAELFRAIARILAKQLDAPRFEPHLTILVTAAHRRSPQKVLKQIQASPIRLRVRGTGFSSKFTKTLFVRFKSSDTFEKLFVDLRRATNSRVRAVRDPHVSLLYKELPASTKKELASTIKLSFREVVFDLIKAVHCALPVRNGADVEAWRAVATKSLRK